MFSSDDDHLAYWLGNSLPVIVVLVNEERQALWQAITPDKVTEKEGRFSVIVPRDQRSPARHQAAGPGSAAPWQSRSPAQRATSASIHRPI
ncbi:MAG: DUF4365 domain-containing protein [Actinomycetota bacterium]|nr:DUF4365 domain-containing protein [Actinomycetota bacterium]